jgi:hypothetical protein
MGVRRTGHANPIDPMTTNLKFAAMLATLTLTAAPCLARADAPHGTQEALAAGYAEMHGQAALRYVLGNSLVVQVADANRPAKVHHFLDGNNVYGSAEDKGCPRIHRILTTTSACSADEHFHAILCEPYRVFRKKRATAQAPENGSEIGILVPGGAADAATRWDEQQPILRGDVTE